MRNERICLVIVMLIVWNGMRYVVHVLDSLPTDATASLLYAGIIVYNPMKQHNMLQPRKKLGVVDPGGLGHVAIKFAKAFGLHVTVISTSASKVLAAHAFLLSTDANQMRAHSRTLDFIINTIAAKHSPGPILDFLKVRGNSVLVGAPYKPIDLATLPLIFGKRAISRSMIGKHITCDIKLMKPNDMNKAMDRLARNDVRYRFVIAIIAAKSSL